jgi:hypothetical protein
MAVADYMLDHALLAGKESSRQSGLQRLDEAIGMVADSITRVCSKEFGLIRARRRPRRPQDVTGAYKQMRAVVALRDHVRAAPAGANMEEDPVTNRLWSQLVRQGVAVGAIPTDIRRWARETAPTLVRSCRARRKAAEKHASQPGTWDAARKAYRVIFKQEERVDVDSVVDSQTGELLVMPQDYLPVVASKVGS